MVVRLEVAAQLAVVAQSALGSAVVVEVWALVAVELALGLPWVARSLAEA